MSTVSVVVTTYQHANYLADALDSVLAEPEVVHEVVVVDDGSTDRPDEVVARYPGVRLLRQDNRGLSAARNAGLAVCTGEWVVFLDADDLLVPGGLRAGLTAARERPDAAVVYGAHVRTGPDGRTVTSRIHVPVEAADPYAQLLRGNPIGMHASALVRRTAASDAGGFDEALRAAEDYDLYLRLAAVQPVRSHPTVVAAYRIHGENMSADPAFMLRSVLRVLALQRRRAAQVPRTRRALHEGVRVWLRYYGQESRRRQHAGDRAAGWQLWSARLQALRLFPGAVLVMVLSLPVRVGRRRARAAARRVVGRLPLWARARLARVRGVAPPVGAVRLGDLDRSTPISRRFGYDRGGPIDRYYIEAFLDRCRNDVRGRVLEIGDDTYTRAFGDGRVHQRDVLHVHAGNTVATFVGDLAGPNDLPSEAFDCVVLTQTLQLVFDVPAALSTIHRILRPGGVLLATVPGISNIDPDEWGPTWYWSFTQHAVRRLAADGFPGGTVEVTTHGNVKAAVTFLHGLSPRELDSAGLDATDPCYPVVVCLRAVKGHPQAA